jgi:hypothetical protein
MQLDKEGFSARRRMSWEKGDIGAGKILMVAYMGCALIGLVVGLSLGIQGSVALAR